MPTCSLDKLGSALSGLCLLHCLAGPLVLGLAAGAAVDHHALHGLHAGMALMVVPVSGWALIAGVCRHRRGVVLVAGVAGLALMLMPIAGLEARLGHGPALTLTALGSVLLMAAHHWNMCLRPLEADSRP
ncbi:MerC domain-containing protein [Spectribacter hydrogenoxidans]|uniref:MerC domain-containing protein n=1 Tax=Spectribacter hydrogenoxidans TaxID=3075608 RepID=A0ABU3BWA2_9GAMM|nr:MerC domain-containing protein [Salinisphaera sp. W335]MDT0633515.1 MerC domain-containing protein [Salinisphaera sp. W335]